MPLHVAISNKRSITLRNKLKRLGLEGDHIEDLISLVDQIGIMETLQDSPIGVRFSTVKTKSNKPNVWKYD